MQKSYVYGLVDRVFAPATAHKADLGLTDRRDHDHGPRVQRTHLEGRGTYVRTYTYVVSVCVVEGLRSILTPIRFLFRVLIRLFTTHLRNYVLRTYA